MWKPETRGARPVVLLVEDDPDLAEMVTLTLQTRGFDVLTSANAAGAIMQCRTHSGPIHLLLTDLGLPGVSGGELARSITAERPEIRVLSMSGIPRADALARGLIKADAPFLAKPFTSDLLVGTVSSLLAGVRGTRA